MLSGNCYQFCTFKNLIFSIHYHFRLYHLCKLLGWTLGPNLSMKGNGDPFYECDRFKCGLVWSTGGIRKQLAGQDDCLSGLGSSHTRGHWGHRRVWSMVLRCLAPQSTQRHHNGVFTGLIALSPFPSPFSLSGHLYLLPLPSLLYSTL